MKETISYKDYIWERDNSLWVPMLPADHKATGCDWHCYNTSEEGWAEAGIKAKKYAAYVRREKHRLGREFRLKDYGVGSSYLD